MTTNEIYKHIISTLISWANACEVPEAQEAYWDCIDLIEQTMEVQNDN